MEKSIYIQVHKLEQEALDAIEKLRKQGFRDDQISVLAYNKERFSTLFRPQVTQAAVADKAGGAVTQGEVPDAVEDVLEPPVVVPPVAAPGMGTGHSGPAPVAPVVPLGLKDLGLGQEDLLSHERSLQAGDILVVLQTDEGQEYRPDLPLKNR